MTSLLLLTSAVSFGAGLLCGWLGPWRSLSRNRVRKAAVARRELHMALTSPLDLEPCEFTGFWRARD